MCERGVERRLIEGRRRNLQEVAVGVVEGRDRHTAGSAEVSIQTVTRDALDVLRERELSDVISFGHAFPAAGLVRVHEDEVDVAFEGERRVAERRQFFVTGGAPRRKEVDDRWGAFEVG